MSTIRESRIGGGFCPVCGWPQATADHRQCTSAPKYCTVCGLDMHELPCTPALSRLRLDIAYYDEHKPDDLRGMMSVRREDLRAAIAEYDRLKRGPIAICGSLSLQSPLSPTEGCGKNLTSYTAYRCYVCHKWFCEGCCGLHCKDEADRARQAVRNVYAVANRRKRTAEGDDQILGWQTVIRFCEQAGCALNFLREKPEPYGDTKMGNSDPAQTPPPTGADQ